MNIWKPHLTVAAVVEDNGRFLFVEEEIRGELVINQPAGHLDEGETLLHAVIRETQEETAYKFLPQALVGILKWSNTEKNKTFVRVAFCGNVSDHAPEQELDDGIVRTLWLTPEELNSGEYKIRSPMVLETIRKYQANERYPIDFISEI
ncbi:MAG: NUDIX hydrolase [Gammaproteobacteria bacterium]|nr:MAG: NUDIX hydrolase [Gammaproteobacteria bacterium]